MEAMEIRVAVRASDVRTEADRVTAAFKGWVDAGVGGWVWGGGGGGGGGGGVKGGSGLHPADFC